VNQILIVESSPRGAESASRQLTRKVRERLEVQYPEAKVVVRDLAKDRLPHLDQATVKAISTRDPVEAESLKDALHLSDQLTEELLSSDLLVIASPMWNFGIPSLLKAWIANLSVAATRARLFGDSKALWPLSGVMMRSASGHARCSAQALSMGQTTS
jgi:FMN-dependent NADH-azoreductase